MKGAGAGASEVCERPFTWVQGVLEQADARPPSIGVSHLYL